MVIFFVIFILYFGIFLQIYKKNSKIGIFLVKRIK